MEKSKEEMVGVFVNEFGVEPLIIKAPGRINLIGEHTDYNDGFVLPAAINLSADFYIQKREDSSVRLIAVDLDESYDFDINDKLEPIELTWANYLLGVLDQLKERGNKFECGFNLVFTSDIPIGAGLSSSAAIECGFGLALCRLYDIEISNVALAKIGQKAEHKYAGVKCGIMDQFASCLGRDQQVIKLDCRSLAYEYYPAQFNNYEIVLFDSNVKHSLANSEYNLRREQCSEGVAALQKVNPKIASLRDASFSDLTSISGTVDEIIYRRCKYVIGENARVENACMALQNGDLEKLGQLMFETHRGLSEDYEVSCEELDTLIDIVNPLTEVIGARMMGGGFGGCTINLIHRDHVNDVIEKVESEFLRILGKETKVYKVSISDGVRQIKEIGNEV